MEAIEMARSLARWLAFGALLAALLLPTPLVGAQTLTWDFTAPAVTEGAFGTTTTMTVTISLSTVSSVEHRFTATTLSGVGANAQPGLCSSGVVDFEPVPAGATFIIPANANPPSTSFNVTVCGDNWDEANEDFFISVSRTAGTATPASSQKRGTIIDDDTGGLSGPPAISVNSVQVPEGNAGTTPANFTVALSAVSPQPATARFSTINLADSATAAASCATAGADLISVNQVVTIPANANPPSITVPVSICGDTVDEQNEGFHVQLTEVTSAACVFSCLTTLTILDDEPSVSIGNATAVEADAVTTTMTFNVILSAAAGTGLTVTASTSPGTATAGAACGGNVDYITRTNQGVQFNVGDTTRPFTVDICGDTRDEPNETLFVDISGTNGAVVTDSHGIGTIIDDDALPALAIADTAVDEDNLGCTQPCIQFSLLDFEVTLTPASGRTVTVNYASGNATFGNLATAGASCGANVDYIAESGQLSFAPGETTKHIVLQTCPDDIDEFNEFLAVTLSGATNATISRATASGRINNDDNPTVSINDVIIGEGISGTRSATFTVSLSHESLQDVTVNFATRDGTANSVPPSFPATCALLDYFPRNSSLTIPAGDLTGTITVNVCGDLFVEPSETFFVDLTLPIGEFDATIADGTGQGTIRNDDFDFDLGVADVGLPSVIHPHEHVTAEFGWLLTGGRHWRQLQTLELRLRNGSDIPLWVRWDEATNQFSLFNTSSGRFGPPSLPGDSNVLAGRGVQLHLDSTQAIGSGPTGSSVALLLDLTFEPAAAGSYTIEVAAVDDTGQRDDFATVGSVTVSR